LHCPPPAGFVRLDQHAARWTGARFLEVLGVLPGKMLVDGSGQNPTYLMAVVFDFGERRIS